ncbi:hypothetical protein GCM10023258_10110 [Terrabacter aeriphilus]|uniref:Uncharacterized protein n=1 Tax=Terrabacter aeriphilus TaxID=515662 RepID=A0ABP9J6J4_9MICO
MKWTQSRVTQWVSTSSWAVPLIGAGAALVAALAKQAVSALGRGGWSWIGLAEDLVTNVFLATIASVLLESSRRLSRFRAMDAFVHQARPMIRQAALAWSEASDEDVPQWDEDTDLARLDAASVTLSTIYRALGEAILSVAATGPEAGANAAVGTPAPALVWNRLLLHLSLYVANGGRARRAVYARALSAEFARVRKAGAPELAEAATTFVRQSEDWMGLVERFNGAFAAWVLAHPDGSPEMQTARLVGEDPMAVAYRWLGSLPDFDAVGMACADPMTRHMLVALRDEVAAASNCVTALVGVLVAARTPEASLRPEANLSSNS